MLQGVSWHRDPAHQEQPWSAVRFGETFRNRLDGDRIVIAEWPSSYRQRTFSEYLYTGSPIRLIQPHRMTTPLSTPYFVTLTGCSGDGPIRLATRWRRRRLGTWVSPVVGFSPTTGAWTDLNFSMLKAGG